MTTPACGKNELCVCGRHLPLVRQHEPAGRPFARATTNGAYWMPKGKYQGYMGCTGQLRKRCDNSKGRFGEQRPKPSCPQVPQGHVLLFPQCPQILRSFSRAARARLAAEKPVASAGTRGTISQDRRASRPRALRNILELTDSSPAHILVRLCAGEGARRRNSEAYVPAQRQEAREGARFPCSYVVARRARDSCRSQAQGEKDPKRLAVFFVSEASSVDTIKSSREIDAVFRGSLRAGSSLMSVFAVQARAPHESAGRVAFIAGKKLGSAVLRNRCRRVLRESVRRCGGPWAGWDVVVVSRTGIATARPEAVDRALSGALRKVGVS